MGERAFQRCTNPACRSTHSIDEVRVSCARCASLLDIEYDWSKCPLPNSLRSFSERATNSVQSPADRLNFSGVWRFRDLMPFFRDEKLIVTVGEGRTVLQDATLLAAHVGKRPGSLFLQYEGLNPSGSFKDNGMTAAFTHAAIVGARRVACASTGNTSASLAMYASGAGLESVVFIGSGKIAFGKLSQALDYGAKTLQIAGDFDACLRRVTQLATKVPDLGIYLMNSVNPFRLEGQKSIMYRVLEARSWQVPDWIVVPGGNLGNCSSFGKAFAELRELGFINRIPRLAVVNATGANTLNELYSRQNLRWNGGNVDCEKIAGLYAAMDESNYHPTTVASAIEISRPVNLAKALRALEVMNGVVCEVPDEQILEFRAMVARFGFGCEPASAATVAGLKLLMDQQVIGKDEDVVCILTGHELKDPNATVQYHTGLDMKLAQERAPKGSTRGNFVNQPIAVADDLVSIVMALGGTEQMVRSISATGAET